MSRTWTWAGCGLMVVGLVIGRSFSQTPAPNPFDEEPAAPKIARAKPALPESQRARPLTNFKFHNAQPIELKTLEPGDQRTRWGLQRSRRVTFTFQDGPVEDLAKELELRLEIPVHIAADDAIVPESPPFFAHPMTIDPPERLDEALERSLARWRCSLEFRNNELRIVPYTTVTDPRMGSVELTFHDRPPLAAADWAALGNDDRWKLQLGRRVTFDVRNAQLKDVVRGLEEALELPILLKGDFQAVDLQPQQDRCSLRSPKTDSPRIRVGAHLGSLESRHRTARRCVGGRADDVFERDQPRTHLCRRRSFGIGKSIVVVRIEFRSASERLTDRRSTARLGEQRRDVQCDFRRTQRNAGRRRPRSRATRDRQILGRVTQTSGRRPLCVAQTMEIPSRMIWSLRNMNWERRRSKNRSPTTVRGRHFWADSAVPRRFLIVRRRNPKS
ncbi:MAG: hypothetical protein QM811_29980 [Pirellulales bacterium]